MDTSESLRLAVLAFIFVTSCVVVFANVRIACALLLGRKVSRPARLVWQFLGLVLLLSVVDAFFIEPGWIQVTHHEVAASGLPSGARLRIVHLSDLHVEHFGSREIRMLELVEREQPDVIVLTGDYLNVKNAETEEALLRIARQLAAVAPCYAVEGNWDSPGDLAILERGGVCILNRWTVTEVRDGVKIALGGFSWLSGIPPVPPETARLFKVLLTHIPVHFDEAARKGIDLTLAGHTHGGQIRIPVFGALVPDPSLVGKYQAGMYRREGRSLYVSRGIGMEGGAAPRVRFWCRPEVAVIDVAGAVRK